MANDDDPPPKGKTLAGAMAGTESSLREAFWGLMGGMAFGLVSPIVGHPLDTVKTNMQVPTARHYSTSVWSVIGSIYRTDGIMGFYRGFVPPLLSSLAYRGLQFSAYAGGYAAAEKVDVLSQPIPGTGGLRPSVLVGSLASATARATVETPFEFVKVRMQVGRGALQGTDLGTTANTTNTTKNTLGSIRLVVHSIFQNPLKHIQNVYQGYTATLLRSVGLMSSFFIMVDYSVRYIPDVINAPLLGPFFKGGICATAAWTFAFPFETVKSVVQSDTTGIYKQTTTNNKNSTFDILWKLYKEKGIVRGWYRGFAPGASRSFIANGVSMIVYNWFQDNIRKDNK